MRQLSAVRNPESQAVIRWSACCLALWVISDLGLAAEDKSPTNLVPNASFELGLGQGLPTHWGEINLTFRAIR